MSTKTKTVIQQYDVATISEVLNREIPDLPITSITIIETGWDHLVAEVNGDWIFRFPRTVESIANLEREKQLLDYLKNHITLAIPHYHYVGTDTAFVGYRKIPGISLTPPVYAGLDLDVRHNIAQTLASFFTELHHAVSKEQALQWGYTNIIRPLDQMESTLVGTLPINIAIMIQKAIAYAREDLHKEQDFVFFHQDVNGDNSAFNATTRQIIGVFDFSDAGIGPRSLEFAELFFIDAELARLTAEIYMKMNKVPNPLIGGAADHILRKATLMLEARKKGNAQDEMNLLKGLSDFLPIWHNVLNATSESENLTP
jgi:aminoglycoside phosphotransferase (APT) family kinase protein